jgi:mono/diheme cytochrome c family protein
MKPSIPLALLLVLTFRVVSTAARLPAQQSSANQSSKQAAEKRSTTSQPDDLARGRYLVEEVAKCPECHTPRDSNGALDHSRWLRGGPIWFSPVQSKPRWAMNAPALAGFPYTDQQGQDILERGIGTNGNPILPPMHSYHLNHMDAVAIILYLRSLSRGTSHR